MDPGGTERSGRWQSLRRRALTRLDQVTVRALGEPAPEHLHQAEGQTPEAVLELLSGKASVDQLARKYGVQAETVEGWRAEALEGVREAMKRGTGRSEREAELERENRLLRETVTESAIAQALLKRALDEERKSRPTGPARSKR